MFRFSIREMLLLTLVVAMGLGWLTHWRLMERRNAKKAEYVQKLKDALRESLGRSDALADALGWRRYGPYMSGKLPPDLEKEP